MSGHHVIKLGCVVSGDMSGDCRPNVLGNVVRNAKKMRTSPLRGSNRDSLEIDGLQLLKRGWYGANAKIRQQQNGRISVILRENTPAEVFACHRRL